MPVNYRVKKNLDTRGRLGLTDKQWEPVSTGFIAWNSIIILLMDIVLQSFIANNIKINNRLPGALDFEVYEIIHRTDPIRDVIYYKIIKSII